MSSHSDNSLHSTSKKVDHIDKTADVCSKFADDSARALLNDIRSKQTEVSVNPKNGTAYAEMAEDYLCAASKHAKAGDTEGTKLLINGTDVGRNGPDLNGKPNKGFDGANDAIRLARENGADKVKLNKLEIVSKELEDWADKSSHRSK